MHQQHSALAAKRQFAREKFEQDHAQRVNVAASIGPVPLAAGLLGRHVGRRAQQLSLDREGHFADFAACQAEVDDVGLAVAIHHDVAGLQIAVDHARLMRMLQRVGELDHDFGGVDGTELLAAEPFAQIGSVDVVA